jgi:hypothetical protein
MSSLLPSPGAPAPRGASRSPTGPLSPWRAGAALLCAALTCAAGLAVSSAQTTARVEAELADALPAPPAALAAQLDAMPEHPIDPFLLEEELGYACDDGQTPWAEVVQGVARSFDAQRLRYSSGALQDCSGMAHRMLRKLGGRCEGVDRPAVRKARTSRDLARWYAKRGMLTQIKRPEDADAAMVVGAIAFYLAPRRAARGGFDGVHHVGIVVDVERDAQGRVTRYSLFHGRRPGVPAGISTDHTRTRSPPLGNGREQLFAVAWPREGIVPEAFRPRPVDDGVVVADGLSDDDGLVGDALPGWVDDAI